MIFRTHKDESTHTPQRRSGKIKAPLSIKNVSPPTKRTAAPIKSPPTSRALDQASQKWPYRVLSLGHTNSRKNIPVYCTLRAKDTKVYQRLDE